MNKKQTSSTNPITLNLLTATYGTNPLIPIELIAEQILGLSIATAKRKASNFELPFPTIRLTNSQKSPYVVHIQDLANFIDKITAEAKCNWGKFQFAA